MLGEGERPSNVSKTIFQEEEEYGRVKLT